MIGRVAVLDVVAGTTGCGMLGAETKGSDFFFDPDFRQPE